LSERLQSSPDLDAETVDGMIDRLQLLRTRMRN
jgi:hypothetical protein